MPRSLVALGSNVGDPSQLVAEAVARLANLPKVAGLVRSGDYRTSPIGGPQGQSQFINAAVSFETNLSPQRLHEELISIEIALGRQPSAPWSARPMDLDLLLYGGEAIQTPALVVPHPRMAFRRFVLEPAAEVAADMLHPIIGWSVGRLLEHLNTAAQYVALMGPPGTGKTMLARRLAADLGLRFVADPAHPAAVNPAADSPSHVLARQIQFLDSRRQVLDRAGWPTDAPLAISDFYFDQSLAFARTSLNTADLAALASAWLARHAQVVQPKLLVALDPGGRNPSIAPQQETLPSAPRPDALLAELTRVAARRGIGPVLWVPSFDAPETLTEVSAAMRAMQ